MENPYQPPEQLADSLREGRKWPGDAPDAPQKISRSLYALCFFLPVLLLLGPFVIRLGLALLVESLRLLP